MTRIDVQKLTRTGPKPFSLQEIVTSAWGEILHRLTDLERGSPCNACNAPSGRRKSLQSRGIGRISSSFWAILESNQKKKPPRRDGLTYHAWITSRSGLRLDLRNLPEFPETSPAFELLPPQPTSLVHFPGICLDHRRDLWEHRGIRPSSANRRRWTPSLARPVSRNESDSRLTLIRSVPAK